MKNTWITADWHLGEDRFEIMGRPFVTRDQMINALVYNHNTYVRPEDTVIVVGDVCYQKTPEFLSHVSRFNGEKILIRGNHDRIFTDKDLYPYFSLIFDEGAGYHWIADDVPCYITHYPTKGSSEYFNLVGHVHSAWKYQLNMLNVGVDVHHFLPVNMNKIPFHFNAIKSCFDDDVWAAYSMENFKYHGKRGIAGSYLKTKHV